MEFIIELILDLFFDSVEEVLPNSKIPKKLRVALDIIACVIIAAIIGGVLLLGVFVLREDLFGGIFAIAVAILLLVGFIWKVIKTKNKAGL